MSRNGAKGVACVFLQERFVQSVGYNPKRINEKDKIKTLLMAKIRKILFSDATLKSGQCQEIVITLKTKK